MNDRKKIIIGSDHAGFEMKHSIISNLSDIEFDDIGTDSDESVAIFVLNARKCSSFSSKPSSKIPGTHVSLSKQQ